MGWNCEKKGHIVKVGMNRPKERNALDPQILMDLHHAGKEINADDSDKGGKQGESLILSLNKVYLFGVLLFLIAMAIAFSSR